MGADRSLGIALHSGDMPLGTRRLTARYALMLANGNGQNQLLNDNSRPAVFGRVELALWGADGPPPARIAPMRARTDGGRLPIVGIGVAAQYNQRTAGNLPNLINESDTGAAFDLIAALYGLDLEAGVLYLRTHHDTLANTPDLERFGWW